MHSQSARHRPHRPSAGPSCSKCKIMTELRGRWGGPALCDGGAYWSRGGHDTDGAGHLSWDRQDTGGAGLSILPRKLLTAHLDPAQVVMTGKGGRTKTVSQPDPGFHCWGQTVIAPQSSMPRGEGWLPDLALSTSPPPSLYLLVSGEEQGIHPHLTAGRQKPLGAC